MRVIWIGPGISIKVITQTDEETGESKEVTEAPTFLLLKWQDDKNLVVTASLAEYDSSKQPQTWVYTLP